MKSGVTVLSVMDRLSKLLQFFYTIVQGYNCRQCTQITLIGAFRYLSITVKVKYALTHRYPSHDLFPIPLSLTVYLKLPRVINGCFYPSHTPLIVHLQGIF